MKRVMTHGNTFTLILVFSCLFSWSSTCEYDEECRSFFSDDKCCHGTCIDKDASCISGGAIAGIVIGCLIVGGVVISFCLCFCCSCGPFQNRNRGTVIRYGQGVQTTTTAVTSHSTYGASYPQPASTQYPVQSQYQTPGPAQFPGAVPPPFNSASPYLPPQVAPPNYEETSKPPPYNPVYHQ